MARNPQFLPDHYSYFKINLRDEVVWDDEERDELGHD